MNPLDPSVFENYLLDLGTLLREMAVEARAVAKGASATEFDVGYMAGFHRVLSLMQQQAEAFRIPMASIGLAGIDPNREFV